MAHENVYGICENLCKVPVYTKSQSDAKYSDVNTFSIATTDWVTNTGATATDYPYICAKTSELFNDDSAPIWQMNGVGTLPTEEEREAINLVMEAIFNENGVTLYATDAVEVALVLEVKGV